MTIYDTNQLKQIFKSQIPFVRKLSYAAAVINRCRYIEPRRRKPANFPILKLQTISGAGDSIDAFKCLGEVLVGKGAATLACCLLGALDCLIFQLILLKYSLIFKDKN